MRDESHLDEMRSAIRGDFERLAERRGEQELMRVTDVEPELRPEPEQPDPLPKAEAEQPGEAKPEPEPEPEPEQRSWLARFFAL